MIIQLQTLSFAAAAAFCPLVTMGALLVPVSETQDSYVHGFVEIYGGQFPDEFEIVDSDSFSDSFQGSAYASDDYRSGFVSAESFVGGTFTSDEIHLDLWTSVHSSQEGHFMDIQGESLNEYRLTFELIRPSTVHLTGFMDSDGPRSISKNAEIELAGWKVSLPRQGGSLTFDTTLQLDAGRYTFAGSSSAVLSGSQCCGEESGSARLQVTAVFAAVPEATPRAIVPAMMLVSLANWRRRIRNPGADVPRMEIGSSR